MAETALENKVQKEIPSEDYIPENRQADDYEKSSERKEESEKEKAQVYDLEKERQKRDNEARVFEEMNSYASPYLQGDYSKDSFRKVYQGRKGIQEQIKKQLESQYSLADVGLLEYVQKNYSEMIKDMDDRGLVALLTNLPIEGDVDEKYQEIISSAKKQKEILEMKKTSEEDMRKYLEDLIEEENYEDNFGEILKYYMDKDGKPYMESLLNDYANKEAKKVLDFAKEGDKKGLVKLLDETVEKNLGNPEVLIPFADVAYQSFLNGELIKKYENGAMSQNDLMEMYRRGQMDEYLGY